jgi:hypothetical protein
MDEEVLDVLGWITPAVKPELMLDGIVDRLDVIRRRERAAAETDERPGFRSEVVAL